MLVKVEVDSLGNAASITVMEYGLTDLHQVKVYISNRHNGECTDLVDSGIITIVYMYADVAI